MAEQVTAKLLRNLIKNETAYRFPLPGGPRVRPPRLVALAAFINEKLPRYEARLENWSYTPERKYRGSRLRFVTGRRCEGKRLAIYERGKTAGAPEIAFNTLEPYTSNWNVVRWIVDELDGRGHGFRP